MPRRSWRTGRRIGFAVATADRKGGRIRCSDRRRRCSRSVCCWNVFAAGKCRRATSDSTRQRSKSLPIGLQSGAKTARDEPDVVGDGPIFTQEERNFWAFQPVQRPSVPTFDESRRVRTPIDALLLQAISESGDIPANFRVGRCKNAFNSSGHTSI